MINTINSLDIKEKNSGIPMTFEYKRFYMEGDDEESERVRDATKSGLIAFIIALLAYLDLKAAPFFIVWLTSYYLQVA